MSTRMLRSIHSKRFFTMIVPFVLVLLLSTTSVSLALDYEDVEMLLLQQEEQQSFQPNQRQLLVNDDSAEKERRASLGDAIKRKVEQQQQQQQSSSSSSISFSSSSFPFSRTLQGTNTSTAACYTSLQSEKSNRYCTMDDTPHENTFLVLACPTTDVEQTDDLTNCACAIGIGEPEEAPNTKTCSKCTFCKDSTLAYDCRNVAEGTCIGVNCNGECVSSFVPETPLEVVSGAAAGSRGGSEWGRVAQLLSGVLVLGSVFCQCM